MTGRLALLTSPREFFASRADSPSLVGPALVVLANAAVVFGLLLGLVPVLSKLDERISPAVLVYAVGGQTVRAPRELAFAAVLPFGVFLGGWLLLTVLVFAVSRYFDGEGSFRRLLSLLGWGFLPGLVPSVAKALVAVGVFLNAPDLATESAMKGWLRSHLLGSVPLRVVALATPLFTLWTAYLWLLAAEYGRALTRRQALVSVALPTAAALLDNFGALARLLV